jgi:hypothetical protein
MRRLIATGFVLEFVSFTALVLTVALAWVGDLLGLSPPAVISASVGLSVAATLWALKWEFCREIRDTLPLYSLLESIEDEELYHMGKTAIERCRVELDNLAKGILRMDAGHVRRYMIRFADAARHHLRLTHVGLDHDRLEAVQPDLENPWYQHNLTLVQRGVTVERFFILHRAAAVDSATGRMQTPIAQILKRQARDGIEVYVVWEEEVDDPELIQELMIVDMNLAMTGFQSWSGAGYADARVYRGRYDVMRCIELFEAIRAKGCPLSELDELLLASASVGMSLDESPDNGLQGGVEGRVGDERVRN